MGLATAAAGEFTQEQLQNNSAVFSRGMREAIQCLPAGQTNCAAVHMLPSSEMGRKGTVNTVMRAMPPMGTISNCPRPGCSRWIKISLENPVFGCDCGHTFGSSVVETQDHPKALKEKAKTAIQQETRYSLLQLSDGERHLEVDCRAVVDKLSDCRRALNEYRRAPYLFPSVVFEIALNKRTIAWLPLWQTDVEGKNGLTLMDFQLTEADLSQGLPKLTDAEMEEILKQASQEPAPCLSEKFAPPEPEEGDHAGNLAMINYFIGCFERGLQAFALCNKTAHDPMVAVSVQAAKAAFLTRGHGKMKSWRTVAVSLQAVMDDNSERYAQACAFPQVNQLTHAERQAGELFTFCPVFGCTTMLRKVWGPAESLQFAQVEKSLLASLDCSGFNREKEKPAQETPAEKKAKEGALEGRSEESQSCNEGCREQSASRWRHRQGHRQGHGREDCQL